MYSYFINKDLKLKSYLLAIKDLKEKYSEVSLNDYNIEFNIISVIVLVHLPLV